MQKGDVTVGFVMHPLSLDDVKAFMPELGERYGERAELFIRLFMKERRDPFEIAELNFSTKMDVNVRVLVQCVLRLPEHFKEDPEEAAEVVVKAAKALEEAEVSMIGLGAFTSIVGSYGRLAQKAVNIPITSGNCFTVHSAVEATSQAAKETGIDLKQARVAVIGASGSIGRALVELLSWQVQGLILVGRKENVLRNLASTLENATYSTCLEDALRMADIVFSASNDPEIIVTAEHLIPGSIVCDIARPRDIAEAAMKREDLLVIEGGIIQLPGTPKWSSKYPTFSGLGLPSDLTFACFSDTVLRGLEPRLRSSSLNVRLGEIPLLAETAEKHGLSPVDFRRYNRTLSKWEV